jgi:hypothetical protein
MAKAPITTEAISQVAGKIDFVIDRLQEMQVFCERSRDDEPSAYIEQSHFIIGVCGKTLDDAYGLLGEIRKGSFDDHPSIITIGAASK